MGQAVAPAVLLRKSEAAGEESPSRTGQRWWLTATGPLLAGQGKCHRKYTAYGPHSAETGKGEMVW